MERLTSGEMPQSLLCGGKGEKRKGDSVAYQDHARKPTPPPATPVTRGLPRPEAVPQESQTPR